MREGLDLPEFGYLPFDHSVVAKWDTTSPLSKNEQKRILVEKWIALGKYGRNDWALAMFDDPIIDNVLEGEFVFENREELTADAQRDQNVIEGVATGRPDRKACEEGWVLALAVNHRGEILPVRVRERATEAAQIAVNWFEGEPLSEIVDDEDEDVEIYLGEGNGWE
ncbi:uncharacterized protein N7525_006870 [Penicillium rubens]|uniref:uncharacterized protein n=1 Tax=Penicillium rubens TaxID=1108849 RepID=UPI002A59AB59|nr:uncharacterized protein N7525_006870 [Penicillium rubens]KAJ5828617.1 hypothetical protein N7525_006870 [Penicillium rubens]